MSDTVFAVVASWWCVVACFGDARCITAIVDLTTSVFGSFDKTVFALLALSHWSAFSLLALDITVSVALTVCAFFW